MNTSCSQHCESPIGCNACVCVPVGVHEGLVERDEWGDESYEQTERRERVGTRSHLSECAARRCARRECCGWCGGCVWCGCGWWGWCAGARLNSACEQVAPHEAEGYQQTQPRCCTQQAQQLPHSQQTHQRLRLLVTSRYRYTHQHLRLHFILLIENLEIVRKHSQLRAVVHEIMAESSTGRKDKTKMEVLCECRKWPARGNSGRRAACRSSTPLCSNWGTRRDADSDSRTSAAPIRWPRSPRTACWFQLFNRSNMIFYSSNLKFRAYLCR